MSATTFFHTILLNFYNFQNAIKFTFKHYIIISKSAIMLLSARLFHFSQPFCSKGFNFMLAKRDRVMKGPISSSFMLYLLARLFIWASSTLVRIRIQFRLSSTLIVLVSLEKKENLTENTVAFFAFEFNRS